MPDAPVPRQECRNVHAANKTAVRGSTRDSRTKLIGPAELPLAAACWASSIARPKARRHCAASTTRRSDWNSKPVGQLPESACMNDCRLRQALRDCFNRDQAATAAGCGSWKPLSAMTGAQRSHSSGCPAWWPTCRGEATPKCTQAPLAVSECERFSQRRSARTAPVWWPAWWPTCRNMDVKFGEIW